MPRMLGKGHGVSREEDLVAQAGPEHALPNRLYQINILTFRTQQSFTSAKT